MVRVDDGNDESDCEVNDGDYGGGDGRNYAMHQTYLCMSMVLIYSGEIVLLKVEESIFSQRSL